VHSHVGFKVKHLFSNVTGRFNEFSGTISGNPSKPEEGQVNVDIRVASIDTKDAKRDQHLRSDEFFDVERFPTMTFVSRKVNRTGEDTAFVIGDLTLRGITREVILQTKYLGRGKGMTGRIHTGFEARTALKRSDFGLTWGKAIEGTQLVGDDIEIDLQIEAVEPKDEVAAPAEPPRPPERVLPEQDGVTPKTEGAPSADPAAQPSSTQTPAASDSPRAKQEGESVPGTTETAPAAPQKPEAGANGSGSSAAPAAGN
jgi:polyisoprenoid-binding protein YceI